MTRAAAACAAALWLAACDRAPTAPSPEQGAMLAHGALAMADTNQVPCCSVDSAGARVTLVGGTLTFYRVAHYTDTVITPVGQMSGACVHQMPDGAVLNAITGLVTMPDGSSFLMLGCDTGTYALALARRFDFTGGSSRTDTMMLSSGIFNTNDSSPDTLSLVDSRAGSLGATVTADTISVVLGGHAYRFVTVDVS